jgi:hypothetical protein
VCSPGAMQQGTCGSCSYQTCDSCGQWGACNGGTCPDGGPKDSGLLDGPSCVPAGTNCYMAPYPCCVGTCTLEPEAGGYFCL